MKSVFKERLKLILLAVLITSSLIQLGILWRYQGHGLPFNFITAVLHTEASDINTDLDKKAREDFFVPYRITASAGYDKPRWILNRTSYHYQTLWKEGRHYLQKALTSGNLEEVNVPWSDIVGGNQITTSSFARETYIFEFKTNIKMDLLQWLMEIDAPTEADGVYKLVISPWENAGSGYITIYIRDSSKIYKYTTPYEKGRLGQQQYRDIMDDISKDKSLTAYSVLNEKYLSTISYDVLGALDEPFKKAENSFTEIYCSPPSLLKNKDTYSSNELNTIAKNLLGVEKDSYDLAVMSNNTIEFRTQNIINRLYKDGLFVYRYRSNVSVEDKGEIYEAFTNAYKMVNKLQSMISGADLYLSGIEVQGQGSYTFIFDYMVNGVPVYMDYISDSDETDAMRKLKVGNAVIIEANSKMVVSCQAVLKDFEMTKDAQTYNLNFFDIMEDAYGTGLMNNVRRSDINDLTFSYRVMRGNDITKPEVVCVVTTRTGESYLIPLRKNTSE